MERTISSKTPSKDVDVSIKIKKLKMVLIILATAIIGVGCSVARLGPEEEISPEFKLPKEIANLNEKFYPSDLTREEILAKLPEAVQKTGEINANETWSGVIHITGDLHMKEGVSLTIEPGTIVFIASHSDDQHGGEVCEVDPINPHEFFGADYKLSHTSVTIDGSLHAVGTPNNPIIITSDNAEPTLWDWDHLSIRNGTLRYTLIEYGWGVCVTSSSVEISHCVIRKMLQQGLLVSPGYGITEEISPNITYNFIYDVGHGPVQAFSSKPYIANNIFIQIKTVDENLSNYLLKGENPGLDVGGISVGQYLGGSATIENNYISGAHNPAWEEGLLIGGGIGACMTINSNSTIRNNVITGGDLAFEIFGGAPEINYNCIGNALEAFMWIHSEYQDFFLSPIDASNNWWGTKDESVIRESIRIMGGGEVPEINFVPFATLPIPNAGPDWREFEWLYK